MKYSNLFKKGLLILGCFLLVFSIVNTANGQPPDPDKIGVLYILHGGMSTNKPQHMWDAVAEMFSYDHNHGVYRFVIWEPTVWPVVLNMETTEWAREFILKYDFSYPRFGGVDPFEGFTLTQLSDMKAELDTNPYGLTFEVDWAGYLIADRPEHYTWPRFIYHGPDGPGLGADVTYCGEGETDNVILEFDSGTEEFTEGATLTGQTSGATATIDEVTVNSGSFAGGDAAGFLSLSDTSAATVKFQDSEEIVDDGTLPGSATAVGATKWPDCDPERFNVDGPVERLLKKGVSRIIVVDTTMSGIRFTKTLYPLQKAKAVLDNWNADHGTSIPLLWVNDYSSLMERSYPIEPEGWTPSKGVPILDNHVLLNGSPNPLAEDKEIAELHAGGIEAAMSDTVPDKQTGVLLTAHALFNHAEAYDPKIDDTIIVNKNIETLLLARHPEMDPDNIVGAFGGNTTLNPENGLVENSREMRGERGLGYAYLYESNKVHPGGKWGYRYWDALEYLKNQGVQHIVVAFTQLCTSSALDLIELPNTLGKELGIKTWAKWETGDYEKFPDVGHPFADYWGNWVFTECDGQPCCFTMGGCGDPSRPYPPVRQTPLDEEMSAFDPSLAFDLSDYGHLGYDPDFGPPDPNGPVQEQYTGTWDMWELPNDDPRVGAILAKHVLNAAVNPMVYITNGNLRGIDLGETVTFEAHVTGGGTPAYTYEWSVKEAGNSSWSTVGVNNATWTWIPGSGEEGTYDIRCSVTDSQAHTGEVIWEDFAIPDPDNDGYPDSEDNCPAVQNLYQEDTYPPQGNDIGDACDCEGNFDCDLDCDGTDAATFKINFGRNEFFGECTSLEPCNGDFDCDGDCDGTDAAQFKQDFGRSGFSNPCALCDLEFIWCTYPSP